MSSQLLQPSTEDSFSASVFKDIPNAQADVGKDDTGQFAWAVLDCTRRNTNMWKATTSNLAQDASDEAAVGQKSGTSDPLATSTTSNGKTTATGVGNLENNYRPNVPVRTSSTIKHNQNTISPMTDSSGPTSAGVTKKTSRNSVKPRSRRGSAASSKKIAEGTAAATASEKAGPAGPTTRSKRRNGFLSFLNCCSPPENAETVELNDQAVPAKRAKVLQAKPGRQPTPLTKPNISAPESSAGESKETTGDGIGGPEYSELKPAQTPKMVTHIAKDRTPSEKGTSSVNTPQPPETSGPPPHDPPLPPLPPNISIPPSDNPRDSAVIRSEPPVIVDPSETVAAQGTDINDRTPQQEALDSDVAMPDAPIVPAVDDNSNSAIDPSQLPVTIPPPPPRGATAPDGAVASEQQRWLLPPLQSNLRGRKCLILDLDETLVHSSFKVCQRHPVSICNLTSSRYSTKPTSLFPLK